MTNKYYINGNEVDLDSDEWELIYQDGRWSSRGFKVFWRQKDDKFVIESWTHWQGEVNTAKLYNRERIIEMLINERHQDRVSETFEVIKAKIPKF